MEQRLGLYVGVEESHRAADLHQAEPNAHKLWLVAHEQGNAVSFPQLDSLEEHMGQPVAALLHVSVRVDAAVVDDKRLVGDAFRLLDEPVHDRDGAGGELIELQLHAALDHLQQEEEISPKVREAEFLQNISGENTGGQSREPPRGQRHVCGRETARGAGGGSWRHAEPLNAAYYALRYMVLR